jgi:plasmid stability protein
MKTIQVRNVRDDTHAVLRVRAAASGMSLQEYLAKELDDLAARPTVAEVVERAGGRSGGSLPLPRAAARIRKDRDLR